MTDLASRPHQPLPAPPISLRPPGVYRPQTDTAVLTAVMQEGRYALGQDVLDVGTGSGALALSASLAGAASVTAVDLSRRSVVATWLNSRWRRAPVTVRRGDLFEPVGDRRFGLIVANPPYVPADSDTLPRHRIARCWDGGLDGRAVLDRICDGAADRLAVHGTLLMIHSAVCGADTSITRLAATGMTATVLHRTRIPFGPVMRARAAALRRRGLLEPDQTLEELVVVEARRVR